MRLITCLMMALGTCLISFSLEAIDPAQPSEHAQNVALQSLIALDKGHASVALNTAIGDRFYDLGQYGWAILYYRRAQALEPRSQNLEVNLSKSHAALGIPYTTSNNGLPVSESEKVAFCLLLVWGLIVVLSALLWWPTHRFLQMIAAPLGLLALTACANLLYDQFGAPVQAIVVRSTLLQDLPEAESDEKRAQPLLEGSVVEVLGTVDQGQWLKVRADKSKVGYVSYASLRII